jgi:hypothetical protein
MGLVEAGLWGLVGGGAAGLISTSAAVVAAGFQWPWHNNPDSLWPRFFVTFVGLIVGGAVAAAAHAQMTGAWPALLLGAAAPSVIRGVISRVEIEESKAHGAGGHAEP